MNIWDKEEDLCKDLTGLEDFLTRFDKLDTFKSDLIEILIRRAEDDIFLSSIVSNAVLGENAASGAFIIAYDNDEYPREVKMVGTLPKGYTITIKPVD